MNQTVHSGNGRRYLPSILYECMDCGRLIESIETHEQWHGAMERQENAEEEYQSSGAAQRVQAIQEQGGKLPQISKGIVT